MRQRFDGFLDYVCGNIISKRERENARNELYDHLMCTYECNLAQGMDEEHAAIEAENAMGDRNAVRAQLEQVHASFPELAFKSALTLVIVGFFFASFQVSLLSGMDILIKLFGQSIMIAAMFCLRKTHKKLKISFSAIVGQYFLFGASTVLTPIAEDHPLPILILSLLGAICGAAFWFFFVGGLIDITKGREGARALRLPLCAISNVFLYALICGAYVYMYATGTTALNADNTPLFFLIATSLIILNMIITITVLRRANKFLYKSGHEYDAECSGLKKTAITLCAFALVLATCAGFDAYRLTRKAETEPYSTADVEISADERTRIENTLADYGVDRDILKLLPNSEIMRFSNAASVDELSSRSLQGIKYTKEYQSRKNSDGEIKSGVYAGYIYRDNAAYYIERLTYCVTDSDGQKHMLCCFKLKNIPPLSGNDKSKNYVDCMEFEESDKLCYRQTYDLSLSSDSLLILTEENGQTVKNKPIRVKRSTDPTKNGTVSNVEFEYKSGMRIFYTADLAVTDTQYPIYDVALGITYIHRNRPILWISERTPKAQITPQTVVGSCSTFQAIRTMHVPYLKSEDSYEPTTECEEETTRRVLHGNSIEEMLAS